MAKTNQAATRRRSATDADGPDDTKTMRRVRVRPGNTLTLGEQGDDGNVMVSYGPGEELEMSQADIDARPWAVEAVEGEKKPKRDGQTSRLKREIEDLKRRLAEAESTDKNRGKEDPNRESALESLRNRGDNFIGRGEPEIGKVPPDALDAFDAGLVEQEMRAEGGRKSLSDEVGMRGLEREHATATQSAGPGVTGATGSIPSAPEGGESIDPKTGDTRGEKSKADKK